MQDPPSIQGLLSAAREHLQNQVIPVLEDPGVRFRTRVAANVLAIAERELALVPAHSDAELKRLQILLRTDPQDTSPELLTLELKDQVAAGAFDEGPRREELVAHLIQTAREKLEITNPRFLDRIDNEDRARRSTG